MTEKPGENLPIPKQSALGLCGGDVGDLLTFIRKTVLGERHPSKTRTDLLDRVSASLLHLECQSRILRDDLKQGKEVNEEELHADLIGLLYHALTSLAVTEVSRDRVVTLLIENTLEDKSS